MFSSNDHYNADVALKDNAKALWVGSETVDYETLDLAVRPLLSLHGIGIAANPTSPEEEWLDATESLRQLLSFPLLDDAFDILRDQLPERKRPRSASPSSADPKPMKRVSAAAAPESALVDAMQSLRKDTPKDWVFFHTGSPTDELRLVSGGKAVRQFGDGLFIVDVARKADAVALEVVVKLPDTYQYRPVQPFSTAGDVREYCNILLSGACCGNRAGAVFGKGGGSREEDRAEGWRLLAEDQINPEERARLSRPLPDTACVGGYAYRNPACTGVAVSIPSTGEFNLRCAKCTNVRDQSTRRAKALQKDAGAYADPKRPFASQSKWQLKQTASRLALEKARLKRLLRRFQSHESDSITLADSDDVAAMDAMILLSDEAMVPASELAGCENEPSGVATGGACAGGTGGEKVTPTLHKAIDVMFPANTTNRAVWDDMVQNVKRRGAGGGGSGCRYSASTMNVAMSILMKTGETAYTELSKLFCFPSARHLRTGKAGAMQCGIMYDSVDSIFRKIRREVAADPKITEKNALVGVLSWDAMEMKGGLLWSAKHSRVVGMSIMDSSLATVQREFAKTVDAAEGADVTSELVTATKYQVFYWTSLGAKSVAFPVAKVPMVSCNSTNLFDILRDVEYALVSGGLTTVAYVSDGAADNRGLYAATGIRVASEFLDAGDNQKLRDMGIAPDKFHVAETVPEQRGFPRFFLSDPPHIWKKIVNHMWKSNFGKTRSLHCPVEIGGDGDGDEKKFKLEPINLQMNKDAHTAAEVRHGVIRRYRRFTAAVFDKDSWSCMVVKWAVQAMSSTMGKIIRHCLEHKLLPQQQLDMYGSMQKLIEVVNDGVDAFNGRRDDDHDFGPITSDTLDRRLQPVWRLLQFFAEWEKNLNDASIGLSAEDKKKYFLDGKCWMDLKQSCLGLICMCHHYLDKYPGMSLWARKLTQDIVEHHFANVRQSFGASRNGGVAGCAVATENSRGRREAMGAKSNVRGAATTYGVRFAADDKRIQTRMTPGGLAFQSR
jgi:hypothetical protein